MSLVGEGGGREGERERRKNVKLTTIFLFLSSLHRTIIFLFSCHRKRRKKKKGRMCGDCFCLSLALNDPCKLSLYPVRSFNVYLFIFVFDNRENGEC